MNKRILNILSLSGHMSETMRRVLDQFMDEWGCSGYDALIETYMFTQSELADYLAHYFKMDRIYNVSTIYVGPDVLKKISFKQALAYNCLPLKFLNPEKSQLEVFLCDPTREDVIQKIEELTACKLTIAIGELSDIQKAIRQIYPIESKIPMLG